MIRKFEGVSKSCLSGRKETQIIPLLLPLWEHSAIHWEASAPLMPAHKPLLRMSKPKIPLCVPSAPATTEDEADAQRSA